MEVLGEKIGEGTFGVAHKGHLKEKDEFQVVQKKFKENSFKCAIQELSVLVTLRTCINVVEILDVSFSQSTQALILKYAGDNLHSVLSNGAFSVAKTWNITKHMFSALLHMHQHNLIHNDLKPANLLLDRWDLSVVNPLN